MVLYLQVYVSTHLHSSLPPACVWQSDWERDSSAGTEVHILALQFVNQHLYVVCRPNEITTDTAYYLPFSTSILCGCGNAETSRLTVLLAFVRSYHLCLLLVCAGVLLRYYKHSFNKYVFLALT